MIAIEYHEHWHSINNVFRDPSLDGLICIGACTNGVFVSNQHNSYAPQVIGYNIAANKNVHSIAVLLIHIRSHKHLIPFDNQLVRDTSTTLRVHNDDLFSDSGGEYIILGFNKQIIVPPINSITNSSIVNNLIKVQRLQVLSELVKLRLAELNSNNSEIKNIRASLNYKGIILINYDGTIGNANNI